MDLTQLLCMNTKWWKIQMCFFPAFYLQKISLKQKPYSETIPQTKTLFPTKYGIYKYKLSGLSFMLVWIHERCFLIPLLRQKIINLSSRFSVSWILFFEHILLVWPTSIINLWSGLIFLAKGSVCEFRCSLKKSRFVENVASIVESATSPHTDPGSMLASVFAKALQTSSSSESDTSWTHFCQAWTLSKAKTLNDIHRAKRQ